MSEKRSGAEHRSDHKHMGATRPSAARPGRLASPLGAEVSLAVVSAAAVFGYARVFAGWDFAVTLGAAAAGGHLSATAARRLRVPALMAWPLSLALGLVAASARFAEGTTRAGLPTRDSLRAMRELLRQAWNAFPEAIAPVPAEGGFLLAAFAGTWLAALLADTFAFRAGAAFESLVPASVAFITCSVLAHDRLRVSSAALFAAACVIFLAAHRSWLRASGPGWLRAPGRRPVTLGGGALALGLAVVAGALAGPRLPGASSESLLDYRQTGNSTRITLSPLVDVRGRLATQSNVVAFTVASPQASYWRLTSLDTFDGSTWTSSRSFSDTDGDLDDAPAGGTDLAQEIVIDQLASAYLPAAFTPVSVDGAGDLAWDPGSATLLLDEQTDPGDRFRVVSRVLRTDAATLDAATATGDGIPDQYLQLPDDLPQAVRDEAAAVTAGATTPYQQAKALQDELRTFQYDLGIRTPADDDPILWFLSIQRGYCEQFSGAFAVMARTLGLPARVAVGFTPGARRADGVFEVRGQHAHAWPEVWFDGIGWMPFEPTPSRGIPNADYTGVPFQQSGEAPAPDTAPTTTAVGDPNATATTGFIRDPDAQIPVGDDASGTALGRDDDSPWPLRIAVTLTTLAVLVVLWPLAVRLLHRWRRSRRRGTATSGDEEVAVAWSEACEALERLGVGPEATETEREFVRRAVTRAPQVAEPLGRLAELAVRSGYGQDQVDPVAVAGAWSDAESVEDRCDAALDGRQRARRWLDPRPPGRARAPRRAELSPAVRRRA